MSDVMTESKIFELCVKMQRLGYAVVIFTPEELRGANPEHVQDRLVELGWDVIDTLATDAKDQPTEEDWNWAIK
jgi:hypothetical protein